MSHSFIYDPVALKEYKEAVLWYEERSEIAAENFVKDVREKIEAICKAPLRYRNSYKYFRETSLKKYPY
ncbi:MAG: type II toxin-antitoxin system RelE/ParE family toxin [Chitinophagaceae bacterium]